MTPLLNLDLSSSRRQVRQFLLRRWRISSLALATMALLVVSGPFQPASAHPHIWIKAKAAFVFDADKVTGVRMQWTFDQFFSNVLTGDFDKDKSKSFSKAESESLRKNAFESVKEFDYFTYIRVDGKNVPIKSIGDFKATIKDGQVTYTFVAMLPKPVSPRAQKLDLLTYDKTYYVDVALVKNEGVELVGAGAAGCSHKIVDDTENPIYFGLVVPKKVTLACTGG